MMRETFFDFLAGGAATGVLLVGIWAGTMETELEHKVNTDDFARIEEKVDDNAEDLKELKGDVKEILRELRRDSR